MMYLEYDWTSLVYKPRAGNIFTDWRGWRSFESLEQAREVLAQAGCKLGAKTASRTWAIVCDDDRPKGA